MTTEKTRGRKPLNTAVESVGPQFVGATPADMAEQERRVNLALIEIHDNATALAAQLGYEGGLEIGALEDEIRFYQRRSVEAVLELGKRLLILKELTPHGEFKQRIELLDINYTMATRFMASTLKFSKVASAQLLAAAGTQSKLLELLVLDNDEIDALESGESVRGITLDDVDTMSAKELRAALREAKDDIEAKERLLGEKNAKLDELAAKTDKKRKRAVDPWPDEVAGLKDDLHGLGKIIDEGLGKVLTLIDATELAILPYEPGSDAYNGYKTVVHHLGESVDRLATLVAGLRNEYDTRLGGLIEIDKTYLLEDPADMEGSEGFDVLAGTITQDDLSDEA